MDHLGDVAFKNPLVSGEQEKANAFIIEVLDDEVGRDRPGIVLGTLGRGILGEGHATLLHALLFAVECGI